MQQLERRARLDRAMLGAVADEDDLGAHGLGTLQQLPGLAIREEPGLVDDPELARRFASGVGAPSSAAATVTASMPPSLSTPTAVVVGARSRAP